MKTAQKHYEVADKAWQPVVGCDPGMPCAPGCWARRTVARTVSCQRPKSPDRAEFYQIALTPDGQKWSGEVYLDEKHLLDPLRWRKPGRVATGFHGDWGRLKHKDLDRMFAVMALCPHLDFMPLTKQPDRVLGYLSDPDIIDRLEVATHDHLDLHEELDTYLAPWPIRNVTIGCSVMTQHEADKMLPAMKAISDLGWRTHVWYEPAWTGVNWRGWEFIEQLIMGGESGPRARPCDIAWFRNSIRWCRENRVAPYVKQFGSNPWIDRDQWHNRVGVKAIDLKAGPLVKLLLRDRKGSDPAEWLPELRVREQPEVRR
jgi:protein gp37